MSSLESTAFDGFLDRRVSLKGHFDQPVMVWSNWEGLW